MRIVDVAPGMISRKAQQQIPSCAHIYLSWILFL